MGSRRSATLAAAAVLAVLLAAAAPAAAADAVVAARAPDPRSHPHIVYGAECNAYMVRGRVCTCSQQLLAMRSAAAEAWWVAHAVQPPSADHGSSCSQDWQVVSLVYSARKAGFKGPITRHAGRGGAVLLLLLLLWLLLAGVGRRRHLLPLSTTALLPPLPPPRRLLTCSPENLQNYKNVDIVPTHVTPR